MSWRTVLIQNKARLRVERRQLIIEGEDGEGCLPVEDIAVLVLDCPQVTLTGALLTALQESGVAVAVTDERHMPAGLYLPFFGHSRMAETAQVQQQWSAPFRKRCWQDVVRQKIANQAHLLKRCGLTDAAKRLEAVSRTVKSGDADNREAVAAQSYWKHLMGGGFQRAGHRAERTDRINAALNYGYAVVRACVARAIVAHGLIPCFGLHHDSNLNAFNLADDLIEPFRPMVDGFVYTLSAGWAETEEEDGENANLSREDRQELSKLTFEQVMIGGQVMETVRAAERTAASLVTAIREKAPERLDLPAFAL